MATDGFAEGSFAHNMDQTCAHPKPKTGEEGTGGASDDVGSDHDPQGFFSEGDSDHFPG
jgi:hypothetical protein